MHWQFHTVEMSMLFYHPPLSEDERLLSALVSLSSSSSPSSSSSSSFKCPLWRLWRGCWPCLYRMLLISRRSRRIRRVRAPLHRMEVTKSSLSNSSFSCSSTVIWSRLSGSSTLSTRHDREMLGCQWSYHAGSLKVCQNLFHTDIF